MDKQILIELKKKAVRKGRQQKLQFNKSLLKTINKENED